jgi:hypothetical protein
MCCELVRLAGRFDGVTCDRFAEVLMRKIIAALLLTVIRSLSSGAMCSAASRTDEASPAAISTHTAARKHVREPRHNADDRHRLNL